MLIFDSRPDPERHPDRLRTIARIKGLEPRPVSSAKILDIGCGTGLDILAHALAYPTAQFVGIDYSQEFIDLGNKIINELEVKNTKLICSDIRDFQNSEKFDYIICHGVYSWVNSEVQQSIFKLLSQCLSATGIAYISFNALPGWHYREIVQKLIKTFDQSNIPVNERVQLAKDSMDKALLALADVTGSHADILKAELSACLKQSPAFIYHELLNFDCTPEYLDQFIEKATSHNLQYLGDGKPSRMRTNSFTAAEEKRFADVGLNKSHTLLTEQFWDLLQPPSLRGCLLCHKDLTISSTPEYSHVINMWVSSGLTPQSADIDYNDHSTAAFSDPKQLLIETNDPAIKQTLNSLSLSWPKPCPVKQVISSSSLPNTTTTQSQNKPLLVSIGEYFLQGLIQLYSEALITADSIADCPVIFPLARSQAIIGFSWVTNTRFEYVPIEEFDRELIQFLNGKNSTQECVNLLFKKIETGDVKSSVDPEHKTNDLKSLLKQQIAACLEHYKEMGLLVT